VIAKIVYQPMGLAISVLGAVLASVVFKRTWKLVAHEEEAPKATDRQRSWKEVLLAAAVQGAVFGLIKATVDRAGARGFERATGAWPA
jgi:hypothetical protein